MSGSNEGLFTKIKKILGAEEVNKQIRQHEIARRKAVRTVNRNDASNKDLDDLIEEIKQAY